MKSQRQKRIMEDVRVKAMSEVYGVSVERIREIEAMALDRLASLGPWRSLAAFRLAGKDRSVI